MHQNDEIGQIKTLKHSSSTYSQKMKRILIILLTICIYTVASIAQNETIPKAYQEQALRELEEKGLTESEVRERLLAEGIDIDKVTLAEIPELQLTIQQIIEELEMEKQAEAEAETDIEQEKDTLMDILEEDSLMTEQYEDSISVEEIDLPKRRGQLLFANIFTEDKESEAPIQVSDNYVLSAGDELTITIFGRSQLDAQFKINAAGFIKPTKMQAIFLKGLTLGKAKSLLRNRYQKIYTFQKEQFIVNVTSSRQINISVLGEVLKHGTLRLKGTSTIFNVLEKVGGPSDIGSVRNIQLIKADGKQIVDLYELMDDPTIQYKYYLEEGDVIHLPVVEKLVTIEGAVRRPMIYELKAEETLQELLKWTGGLTFDAYKKNIQIERIESNEIRVIDVDLEELMDSRQTFLLKNGDKINIRTVPKLIQKTVKIAGAVDFAGTYNLFDAPRLSDLIEKGQVNNDTYLATAILSRRNANGAIQTIQIDLQDILENKYGVKDISLNERDSLTIFNRERYTDEATITISGAVRDSISQPIGLNEQIKVSDAIILAGGLKPDAYDYGYVQRPNLENPKEIAYFPVDLRQAIENPESSGNIALLPYDELTILSNADFSEEFFINISGAVRNPGDFRFHPTLTLKDVLRLSGGFQLSAALNKIDVFRLKIEKNKPTKSMVLALEVDSLFNNKNGAAINFLLQPFDEIVVRNAPKFELHRFVELEGEVLYPGRYVILEDNETVANIIKRAGGLTKEAFSEGANLYRVANPRKKYKEEAEKEMDEDPEEVLVVMHLNEVLKNKKSKYNYILKNGDKIEIPKKSTVVSINTENTKASDLYDATDLKNKQIKVAHEKGKRANWYIKEYALNFGENAHRKNVSVKQPNGELKRTKQFLFFKQYPIVEEGSVINIGAKPLKKKKGKKDRKPVNWEKTVATVFQTISLLVTTVLLIERL